MESIHTSKNWRWLGNCDSYSLAAPNEVTFRCGEAALRVKACAPEILKIWLAPDGNFRRKYPSFTVEREDLAPAQFTVTDQGAYLQIDTTRLTLIAHKAPLRIDFHDHHGNVLTRHQRERGLGWNTAGELAVWHELPEDECFWGMGEKREDFNKRGLRICHWATDLYQPDEFSPAEGEGRWYGAAPHFLSSRGYAIFFDNTSRTCFDFGKTDLTAYSFGSFAPAPGGELIYYFIYGPSPKALIQRYTDLAGKPFFPPLYALGNGQSWWGDRWYQADIEACAQTYREKQIPCDILWGCLEWYLDLFTPSAWNYQTFPDPKGMIERLHRAGFRFALYDEANLPLASADGAYAAENGYLLSNASGAVETVNWPWGGTSGLVDLFNPQARHWWAHLHDHVVEAGVDCFWLDMNEPAVSSKHWVFHNESGGEKGTLAEMHNVYAWAHNKTMYDWYLELYPNRRPFYLSRSYFPGSHRYAAVWSGDVHSSFEWLRFQPRLGLSMGLSGYLLWAHDIGGYSFGNPDEELFKRWIEFAAFCPLHRFHHTCTFDEKGAQPNFPWRYGAEEVSRRYITLRQRLLPYFYSCIADAILGTGLEIAEGCGGSGIPLMRPLMLEYPEDRKTYSIDDQFLCGPFFLIAPVLERGARSRSVYLPEGWWYDYDRGALQQGPATVEVQAPLDHLPVFVKAGAIIPLAPPMQHVGEVPVNPLTLDIFPPVRDGSSSFVLYEDDGESFDYQKGGWCTTRYACLVQSGEEQRSLLLTIEARQQGALGYQPAARDYQLQLHGAWDQHTTVQKDGQPLSRYTSLQELEKAGAGWTVDVARRLCIIKVPDSGERIDITIRSARPGS